MRTLTISLLACIVAGPVHAQQASPDQALSRPSTPDQVIQVEMRDAKGQPVGTVRLRQLAHGLLVDADLRNLPSGPHGFHIHERGACEPPGFQSAGGHLNPAGAEHGLDSAKGPHAGDLPNIHATAEGRARAEYIVPGLTLDRSGAAQPAAAGAGAGGRFALLDQDGAAIMVHAGPDDYRDNDSAGGRIACGVVVAP